MAARRFSGPDRREQVMRVAGEVFARQGFKGTTTRQIAESARINEAIIFRHFPRKEDLYWAIIEEKCRASGGPQELARKLGREAADREVFSAIAEELLRRHVEDSSLMRLLLFSALENHRLSRRFFRTYVARYYRALASHIRRRIRQSGFRPVDPNLAARALVGMLIHFIQIQEIFGGKRYQKFDLRRVSDTLTDIWLKGMLVRGRSPSRGRDSSRRR